MTAPILAIDPGPTDSGFAILDGRHVVDAGTYPNDEMLNLLSAWQDDVAIEMIASYGMPVGREVFETCVWIGRFVQAYEDLAPDAVPDSVQLITRQQVKLHVCGSPRAKDANVRQALIDLIGPAGTKAAPGPTYGVKTHAWAALGVAVAARELR